METTSSIITQDKTYPQPRWFSSVKVSDQKSKMPNYIQFNPEHFALQNQQSDAFLFVADLLISSPYFGIDNKKSEYISYKIESAINWIIESNIGTNDSEVRDYLLRYSDMIDLTIYACRISLEKFALNYQLYLEVYKDPEIEDEYLVLFIRQHNYDDDIVEKTEDICSKFENLLINTSGWITVTTDFLPAE